MKSQVHNLQNLSDETVRGLLESLQLQEVLEQQQKQILDNQERMLQQGQEVCSLTCIPVLPTVDTHTSIVQLLPVCRQHVRQPRATLRRNPQRICTYKHFNALGGIHILVGIVWLGATWFLPAGHFWLMSFYLVAEGPLSLLSQGGRHTSAPHWIHAWASPNKQVAIEKPALTIYGQRTYIQPIVLQEGVHTIRHFA